MTGATCITSALAPRRLELVREILRKDTAIAILINPDNPLSQAERRDAEAAGRAIGQRLQVLTASNEREIETAFAELKQRQVGALIIAADTFYFGRMNRMATLEHSMARR